MEFIYLKECFIEGYDSYLSELVSEFLSKQGLRYDNNTEYTYVLLDVDKVIATGSLDGKVIKYVSVEEKYQGMAITNKIISHLLNKAYNKGRKQLFVYTKPKNLDIFLDLGFYKIAEVFDEVVLLENENNGIEKFIKNIPLPKTKGYIISSVVVNCNPFTLGHQYLIEKASMDSDWVYVFVVSEDKSDFSTEIRFNLVKEGTKHLKNVTVCQTNDYLISNATFPSYFLKKYDDAAKIHALLDIEIFTRYFVPILNINRRYVGEEPLCELTAYYNNTMKSILPKYGVEVIELPRKKIGNEVISASRVRKLLKEGKIVDVKKIVPLTTYNFLTSSEGQKIIDKIKNSVY
ncbi:MAG: citC [Caloramator sp.]|jgi:[citrate (pro-3S)-lyase] ligase|uniref:[citrate (pro-3S)-lyase] ligase n=1 Tax=Caloramator sp. TaxID=1871330 RepID=UPI001DA258EA|nr:[citrate (pro-3S)-lyase] ligase [Caloramator sp.]MBZ4663539.1 citC [Caloramator sp.]